MLFVANIVLITDREIRLNLKREFWREILEIIGFKISRTEIEYMKYNFHNKKINYGIIKIDNIKFGKCVLDILNLLFNKGISIKIIVNHIISRIENEWST